MSDDALHEHFVPSAGLAPGRRVWTLPPCADGRPAWAAVFLDAELYLERVEAPAVLRRLQADGTIPPTVALFVAAIDGASRHADLTCSATFADFVARDVVPWALDAHRGVDPSRLVLLGLSLSALAAAHLALVHPGLFRAAICQSPSMWWSGERYRTLLPDVERRDTALWISVGNEETEADVTHAPTDMHQGTSQLDSCTRAVEALRAHGFEVGHRVFDGGHDPACWREDLVPALRWARERM